MVLYDSNEMGLGCNRFMNHVFSYKGPTLTLLKADNGSVFCIASVNEWKESHLYWGGEDSAVFQILPKYVELFFFSIRVYSRSFLGFLDFLC